MPPSLGGKSFVTSSDGIGTSARYVEAPDVVRASRSAREHARRPPTARDTRPAGERAAVAAIDARRPRRR